MAVVALGGFGIWANVGAACTPSSIWTNAQTKKFLTTQLAISPGATESMVRTGDRLPYFAPAGNDLRHVQLLGSLRLDRLRLRDRATSTTDAHDVERG